MDNFCYLVLDECFFEGDLQVTLVIGCSFADDIIVKIALSNLDSVFLNIFTAERVAFLLISISIEFIQCRWRNIVTLTFWAFPKFYIYSLAFRKSFQEETLEGFLDLF